MEMNNKEFAEKHAGEYFLFRNKKVRVVGYNEMNSHSILVSIPVWVRRFGWGKGVMDGDDILVIPSKASKFWYVDETYLKKWE